MKPASKRKGRRVRRVRKSTARTGDSENFSVREVLEAIARDRRASAASRVSACRVLVAMRIGGASSDDDKDSGINELALQLLGRPR